MLNFFEALISFFFMLGSFIANIVSGLTSMLGLILPAFTTINYSIGFMPAALQVFALAGIGICVVFHIIGR